MELPPAWMRACPDCAAALDHLGQLAAAADGSGWLMARELLCGHVAERHPEGLPGPVEGCPNCAEWTLYQRSPGVDLAALAAQHYAAHLLPAPPG